VREQLEPRRPCSMVDYSISGGKVVGSDKIENRSSDLAAARHAGFNRVSVILWFRADEAEVEDWKTSANCLAEDAIVEEVQGGSGQELHERFRETWVIHRADGEGFTDRQEGLEHALVVALEFGPESSELFEGGGDGGGRLLQDTGTAKTVVPANADHEMR